MSDHEVVLSHPDQVEVLTPIDLAYCPGISTDHSPRKEGHGLCYHRQGHEHVSITKDAFDSLVQQLLPQGLLDSSGIGQGMSDIEREAMTRWCTPVIRNPTDVEVGPGHICGLAMERIGTKLLYGTKISMLVGKCFFNTRRVEEHLRGVVTLIDTGEGEKTRNRLLKK
ncbi:hypothetical protein BU17DRAFT_69659 [Hysterangium stoloniferum]|nr:hypothetical protein BU17DRAFT_69659 [Hysterangium stoloniferum]